MDCEIGSIIGYKINKIIGKFSLINLVMAMLLRSAPLVVFFNGIYFVN